VSNATIVEFGKALLRALRFVMVIKEYQSRPILLLKGVFFLWRIALSLKKQQIK
jgi:hypothetical protein